MPKVGCALHVGRVDQGSSELSWAGNGLRLRTLRAQPLDGSAGEHLAAPQGADVGAHMAGAAMQRGVQARGPDPALMLGPREKLIRLLSRSGVRARARPTATQTLTSAVALLMLGGDTACHCSSKQSGLPGRLQEKG